MDSPAGDQDSITHCDAGKVKYIMECDEAAKLVINEGISINGLVVEARGGQDPELDRLHDLICALKSVRDGLRGKRELDREVAFAAYSLAFHLSNSLSARNECPWHDFYIEMIQIIEQIFDSTYDD